MWSFFITIDAGKGGIVMAKAETAQQRLAREMEELYLQYRSPMFRVAMAILRDEGLAEDAVQQAFLKIFQNFENIQREDWGYTAASRSCAGGWREGMPMGTERELEQLLAVAGEGCAAQLASQLESGEREFSPRFQDAMSRMIARESARGRGQSGSGRRQLKAAVLALVCLAGLGLGVMRVEAFRLPLLDFLVGEKEDYTQVQLPSLEDNATFGGEVQDYLPTWLPEGYQLERVEEDSRFIHGVYAGKGGERLLITATPSSGSSVMLDRQGAEVTQTEIGTRGAFIAKRASDQRIVVLMFDNSYAYTLTGYLPQEDAIAIMESIPGAG